MKPGGKRVRRSTPHRPLKDKVLGRDRDKCVYCGNWASVVDHIIPLSLGGKSTLENLVAACNRCNYKLKDRAFENLYTKKKFMRNFLVKGS